jgi:hypothetical protein
LNKLIADVATPLAIAMAATFDAWKESKGFLGGAKAATKANRTGRENSLSPEGKNANNIPAPEHGQVSHAATAPSACVRTRCPAETLGGGRAIGNSLKNRQAPFVI